jgi:hypothetical protein
VSKSISTLWYAKCPSRTPKSLQCESMSCT